MICGGVLGAYLDQQNDPRPITAGRGAFTGFLSGLIGAFVWLVVSIVVNLALAPIQRQLAGDAYETRAIFRPKFERCSNRSVRTRQSVWCLASS